MNSKTILVVDDNDQMRAMLTEIIAGEGYTVLQAEQGQQALNTLENHDVDLMVLDILMPEKDGLEVIRELRSGKNGMNVKIIAISGGGREQGQTYIQLAQRLGACETLVKPFNINNLIEKISLLLLA